MAHVRLATASWKLRHDEPLDHDERELRLLPVPAGVSLDDHAPVIEVAAVPGLDLELQAGRLPVALLRVDGPSIEISHLLLRVEPEAFQLIRPPLSGAGDDGLPLLERLRLALSNNHLYLNNFECFYLDARSAAAREHEIFGAADPEGHALRWLRHVAAGGCAGFVPAFADELSVSNHRTTRVRACAGTANSMAAEWFDTRRKPSWDAGGCRLWQRATGGSWHAQPGWHAGMTPAAMLLSAPDLLHVAAEIHCEARASGHVHAVRFEHVVADSGVPAARYRCRVSYVRSRGEGAAASIAAELDALTAQWRQWAHDSGLLVEPTAADAPDLFDLAIDADALTAEQPTFLANAPALPGRVDASVPVDRARLLLGVRERSREIRAAILERFPEERAWMRRWLDAAPGLGWVLGGPRCGTSAFKGALSRHERVLSLPGEHRCYFTMLGRNYPDHGLDVEADDLIPLAPWEREELLEMILLSAFAGQVVSRPDDRELARYAWEWALRLPMQWPQLTLPPERVVPHIERAVRAFIEAGGRPGTEDFDIAILKALRELDVRIDPRMYDLPASLVALHFGVMPARDEAPVPVIVEITPYVVLQPRRLKTPDLAVDTLLLKASSDPFRTTTMSGLFAGWDMRILHLTRNPFASINGLLDGWGHRGFWQHDLAHVPGMPASRRYWKFDLVDDWRTLARGPLVALAAEQWRVPNQRLLDGDLLAGAVSRRFAFEEFLRQDGTRTALLERAFATLGLQPDGQAREAMRNPPSVNVTKRPAPARWRARADELRPLLADEPLCDTARRLGYDPQDSESWV